MSPIAAGSGERIFWIMAPYGPFTSVRKPTGALPAGAASFSASWTPGISRRRTYPLEKLRMTGYAFAHREFPETMPQFFVSELHVDRFSKPFQAGAERVFGNSRDPLTGAALSALAEFPNRAAAREACPPALREIVPLRPLARGAHFDRLRLLLAESARGRVIRHLKVRAFSNHASDRVVDVA